ncbi:GrpE, mitochondrial [Malassezia nana]|uniref:GrpE protein homolog n=1 Tax=Malassezia nana TaxID=180528 RepID=A0AAF0ESS7_9BASI|nr:GrpE, mitochondrial [Malassezia nana]
MRAATCVRYYTDKASEAAAPNANANANANAAKEATPQSESPEAEPHPLEAQLKEKEARIKDLTDDLLYTKAELQNLQRRSAEEKKSAGDVAITKLAKDLTESIDVLDLALKSVPEPLRKAPSDAAEAPRSLAELYDGVSLTRKSISDMLRTHGIESFNPLGEKFDPKLHEALYQAPVPGKEPGSVLDCSKIGYMIKGKLLRAAQVGVVQDSA